MKTVNYTGKGDGGRTKIYNGIPISKDAVVLEAVGTIDELNSMIGGGIAFLESSKLKVKNAKLQSKVKSFLTLIQNDLFDIQAILAGYDANCEVRVREMELLIKELDQDLPQLKNFILPGGSLLTAQFHLCRTVCRRAERRVITYLDRKIKLENFSGVPIKYLNRLSSLFFVLARWANQAQGIKEVKWSI